MLHVHIILLHLINLNIFCEQYKLWSSPQCSFLYRPPTSSLLGPASDNFNPRSSLNVSDRSNNVVRHAKNKGNKHLAKRETWCLQVAVSKRKRSVSFRWERTESARRRHSEEFKGREQLGNPDEDGIYWNGFSKKLRAKTWTGLNRSWTASGDGILWLRWWTSVPWNQGTGTRNPPAYRRPNNRTIEPQTTQSSVLGFTHFPLTFREPG
jgi:hypothetical protein